MRDRLCQVDHDAGRADRVILRGNVRVGVELVVAGARSLTGDSAQVAGAAKSAQDRRVYTL